MDPCWVIETETEQNASCNEHQVESLSVFKQIWNHCIYLDQSFQEGELEREQELITKWSWSYYYQYAETQHFYHDYCDEWDLCKALNPGARAPIEEDEDNEEGISEDYHMVVRELTPPPPYPPLPPSYPYNSMPPLSPSPSPLPTLITFDLNVWGGNLPGQLDPTSNITQFMPFGELLRLCYSFLDDAGELPIGSMVQHIPNGKAIHVLGYSIQGVKDRLLILLIHCITGAQYIQNANHARWEGLNDIYEVKVNLW